MTLLEEARMYRRLWKRASYDLAEAQSKEARAEIEDEIIIYHYEYLRCWQAIQSQGGTDDRDG
jgi:hypothetical protein